MTSLFYVKAVLMMESLCVLPQRGAPLMMESCCYTNVACGVQTFSMNAEKNNGFTGI